MVIAYYMVKKAYDEGYALGLAEARKEAYADADEKNAEYYKRMQEAHARGEDFNEPPPTFNDGEAQG